MAEKATPSNKPLNVTLDTFLTAPAILGWANITDPDEAFGELKFKADVHFDEDAQALLAHAIDAKLIEPLWDKFLATAESLGKAAPKGGFVKPDGASWVEDHLKEPKEKDRIQVPFIRFSNDAAFKDKQGEMKRKTMRIVGLQSDGTNVLLDRALLANNRAKGSRVRLITRASIWASALSKGQAELSFKLQGVQVLKLEQAQQSAGNDLEGLSDEEMAALGTDFEADDFSAYARGPKEETTEERPQRSTVADDLDDEIPF